jgi:histidinol-phosphate aminotransferase
MAEIERYPEGAPEQLAEAIGATFGLDPARIVCGHGSDDLLARLARAYLAPGDALLYSCHGYQKFPNYAHANDAEPIAAPDRDFRAEVESLLARVTPRTRVVMIANPDNPTGTYLSAAEVARLHAGLPENVLLVLDSAYAEYADADDYELPVRLVEESRNVVMTRTFSKAFGLAGMRLGWLYAAPEVADVVRRVGITFPISRPALAAGLAALADSAYLAQVQAANRDCRTWFSAHLSSLGLQCYRSQTNFVLAAFSDPTRSAAEADAFLQTRGVFARRMAASDFKDTIRFTLGREQEMRRTAEALSDFLEDRGERKP